MDQFGGDLVNFGALKRFALVALPHFETDLMLFCLVVADSNIACDDC